MRHRLHGVVCVCLCVACGQQSRRSLSTGEFGSGTIFRPVSVYCPITHMFGSLPLSRPAPVLTFVSLLPLKLQSQNLLARTLKSLCYAKCQKSSKFGVIHIFLSPVVRKIFNAIFQSWPIFRFVPLEEKLPCLYNTVPSSCICSEPTHSDPNETFSKSLPPSFCYFFPRPFSAPLQAPPCPPLYREPNHMYLPPLTPSAPPPPSSSASSSILYHVGPDSPCCPASIFFVMED